MVKVSMGILIECDPAMKQFLLYMDDKSMLDGKFIQEDIDETHLFIDPAYLDKLKKKIDDLMEAHAYKPDQL